MLPIESNARNFKKIENEAIIICKYEYSCKYILSLLNIYRQGDENMRKLFWDNYEWETKNWRRKG